MKATLARKKSRKTAPRSAAKDAGGFSAEPARRSSSVRRKNPRLHQGILLLSSSEQEEYFENILPEEAIKLFDASYPSDLVNLLLGLKKSTCRRLFEGVVQHRKKAYLDIITLYHYKDYLTNPLPLTIEGEDGKTVPNYYAIVGMSRDSSEEEMQAASKLLIHAYQAESFPPGDRRIAEKRFEEIRSAFDHLKGAKRRQEADRQLPNINYLYPRRDQSWFEMVQRLIS